MDRSREAENRSVRQTVTYKMCSSENRAASLYHAFLHSSMPFLSKRSRSNYYPPRSAQDPSLKEEG